LDIGVFQDIRSVQVGRNTKREDASIAAKLQYRDDKGGEGGG